MAKKIKNKQIIPFSQKLILNSFLLKQLGFDNFKELSEILKHTQEGYKEDGISYFFYSLINSEYYTSTDNVINKNLLLAYDMNIAKHTKQMQGKRSEPISWKYFQWTCLMFVEIYLHKFFTDKENFVKEINSYKANNSNWEDIPDYTIEDLNKVAIWNATGSGKTLLMHLNLFQYNYYLEKYNKQNSINKQILITPNEGLSRQHLKTFQESNIQAEIFNKNSSNPLFERNTVQIIEVTKLKDEGKETTVSTDSFEKNNLVFIDEVHKGTQGKEFKKQRDKLSEKGFAFEYSATLGQAVKSSKDEDLENEYAKSTLFDYSYKWFYGDGYGKDYKILNLEETGRFNRNLYLTGCLLTYYQQLLIWGENKQDIKQFNIQKPLWIFVGSTVSKSRNIEKESFPDVVEIILFLYNFIENDTQSKAMLKNVVENGLIDSNGNNIFSNCFPFVDTGELFEEKLFKDILLKIFNTTALGKLHLKDLKGASGEIALCIGDNKPFGLINVGDSASLIKLCKQHNEILISDENFKGSMFDTITKNESPLNILIGSRKFTEGWDCFRVSTMGLMNIGRSEGSEIIQLFGRGVRLKGYNNKLKRLSYIDTNKQRELKDNIKAVIRKLETLNIFGVRADYMKQFKDYLESEGLPTGNHEMTEIQIPVVKNLPKNKMLKTVRLKEGVDFKKEKTIDVEYIDCLQKNPVVLDWYPKVQAMQSSEAQGGTRTTDKTEGKISQIILNFIDWQRIYFDLQDYKAQKTWYNINLDIDKIKSIFAKDDWYKLYIPPASFKITEFSDYYRFYDIVLSLLKKYCDKFYSYQKADWEKDKLEYKELTIDDNNFDINNYLVYVDENYTREIEQIRKEISEKKFEDWTVDKLFSIYFDKHLYNPILVLEGKSDIIEVKPVALNRGESKFVTDLRKYYTDNKDKFKDEEIYLLRNRSKKGIGFFEEGGFYPDFIMWHIKGDKQYVTFIDPKGIRNLDDGQFNPKLNFYGRIKEIEKDLKDSNIILNSVIVSITPMNEIPWKTNWEKKDFTEHHCLFQDDINYIENIFKFNI